MALGKLSLSRIMQAVAATANTLVMRGGDSTVKAANHASLGSAGSAGTAIVADSTGKVPVAAVSGIVSYWYHEIPSALNVFNTTDADLYTTTITITRNCDLVLHFNGWHYYNSAATSEFTFMLRVNGVDSMQFGDSTSTILGKKQTVAGVTKISLTPGTYNVVLRGKFTGSNNNFVQGAFSGIMFAT